MKENYKAWEIEPIKNAALMNKKDFYAHLVGWAILAANSHNVQPWRFILKPKKNIIDVCVTKEGILPISDPTGRQAFISVGCALENLITAMQYYFGSNYGDIELTAGHFIYPEFAAKARLQEKIASDYDGERLLKLQAIKKRTNNRAVYQTHREICDLIKSTIKTAAKIRKVKLHLISDDFTKKILANIQSFGDSYVIANKDFRRELSYFLLPNDTENFKGMPGNTFGLNDEMAKYVHEELKKTELNKELAKNFAAGGKAVMNSAPVIGVITIPKDEPREWIKAGRAFQRIALIATMHGISVAIHAAMVEVGILNWLLRMRLKTLERPAVVFRMGYCSEQTPHSPRMPAEHVTEVI
ncbi:MAG: hypothetical protein AAB772_01945 [Patescibacteria group bacterium]